MEPIVSRPGEGERHDRADGYRLIRAETAELSVIEFSFDESFEIEPHVHDDHVDSFFVLEGEIEFTLGEETLVLGPGAFVAAPPGARHGFRGTAGRARMLNFHAPNAGFTELVRSTTKASKLAG